MRLPRARRRLFVVNAAIAAVALFVAVDVIGVTDRVNVAPRFPGGSYGRIALAAPAPATAPAFTAVVLGASGGIDESDLTCVLLARAGRSDYLALDAGTVYAGLVRAIAAGSLNLPAPAPVPLATTIGGGAAGPPSPVGRALTRQIHGYFLSHPHLDHVAGLVIASPEDSEKRLYGLPGTLDALREHLFKRPTPTRGPKRSCSATSRRHSSCGSSRASPRASTPRTRPARCAA